MKTNKDTKQAEKAAKAAKKAVSGAKKTKSKKVEDSKDESTPVPIKSNGILCRARKINSAGRPKSYTPEEFQALIDDYIADVVNNPEHIQKISGGRIVTLTVQRPMTVVGFCAHSGMLRDMFYSYEALPGYSDIAKRAKAYFLDQKLTGASLGIYDSNIIARETGLGEKVTHDMPGMKTVEIRYVKADKNNIARSEAEIEAENGYTPDDVQ